jgi:hypothetical protein
MPVLCTGMGIPLPGPRRTGLVQDPWQPGGGGTAGDQIPAARSTDAGTPAARHAAREMPLAWL